ncbi:MAG: dihydrolipoyl dehydrogenase [Deltaproteobacteria bacterium]|nr:dihydrolipoyl dehydrogenase [Deltaproteobacteria bacterium]
MYDLFVIGAGPGGYSAAILGAKKGLRVAIGESRHIGGTCTNWGCIPTKTYVESVNLYQSMLNARRFGIDAQKPTLELQALVKRKDRITGRLVKGIEHLLNTNNVDIYRGNVQIIDHNKLKIGDEIIRAGTIIIASGAKPIIPEMFRIPGILTSKDIFEMTQVPPSLIIIGGGVIGMEMAHIFSALGSKVSVVELMDRILSMEDQDVSAAIMKLYRRVNFITSARITALEGDDPFKLTATTGTSEVCLEAESVLLCIGMTPYIPKGLEDSGIILNKAKGIQVDETMQTSIPGIYAIGDVTGEHMLAYVAIKEAEVAVDHITGGKKCINYNSLPSIIFTSPEIASVGKNPQELTPDKHRTGTFPLAALGRARTMEANDGFAKIVCTSSGKIERISIVAPHATELIAWAALAIDQDLCVDEFLRPHYPHPTLSEMVKEAADDLYGMSIHKP